METNIILTATKHLMWRVTLYRELSEAYEIIGAYKPAMKVILHGIKQVQQLREIEEGEPPVPEVSLELKGLEMKFGMLSG
eukprot:CAMPEP_0168317434 /NCGR_PEP_ID=MMETSP0210-20121227/25071_1 /TAXON_ID=40633 /ORGANISM="Condylostoma magnum, Strain COL2" /LENGTH=79 /DNA_ID=CAMNT_0008316255 /DNA_START=181 /DNA_END=420 /DNA_ORIENTATION=+